MIPLSDQIRQPLLKSKLSAPEIHESLVIRPHLVSLLSEGADRVSYAHLRPRGIWRDIPAGQILLDETYKPSI